MESSCNAIILDDYENHMKYDSALQLQTLNKIMYDQIYRYPVSTIMILGIAGGNGLNHIIPYKFNRIYGVDINEDYLKECVNRYPKLKNVFRPIKADLMDKDIVLPKCDIIIANLLIEYIGFDNFQSLIAKVRPVYLSCVIQSNTKTTFVSSSPYIHNTRHLDTLDDEHETINEIKFMNMLRNMGYDYIHKIEYSLPDNTGLVRLDFKLSK